MILKKVAGIILALLGLALLVKSAFEGWEEGVDWQGLLEQVSGIGLMIGGLALAFGSMGAAIGSIIGGIVAWISSVKSAIVDGNKEWSNTLSIVLGISAVTGGSHC